MPKPITVIQDYAGVTVVTIQDSAMLEGHTIARLGQEFYELVDKKNKQKLIVDFSNVRFLSSQVLGILLTLDKKSKAIKGKLALCGLRDELMKVFKISGIDKMFAFFPDDSKALSSFGVNVS